MTTRHVTTRSFTNRHRVLAAIAASAASLLPLGGQAAASPGLPSVAGANAGHPVGAAPRYAAGGRPTAYPRLAPAAAVGKLGPTTTGCTVTPATDTAPERVACDLWAKVGSMQVLGQSIPIWGYSLTETGAPSAPGPLLVVRQGDEVSLTLHNQLAEATSLTLPGQRAEDFSGGLPDDGPSAGIATGATATTTFTASRPGSFLYEAGHTAGGARQVAMGLAGALVVLGDGTAYGQGYDDEAVLVLTEIDPGLNTNPAGFDMRDFAPKYRLINGKPFPSSDPVSTEQNHRVLLRYVNAGSESHSMSLLGGEQQLLSHDGHALAFPEPSVVAAVDAGVTVDALVSMPSGPESKFAVYESAARLDNAGQTTADPLSLAFGGMLTFLDTNAPPPSTDAVGPVSTSITATPNPSDGTSPVTVAAHVSDATTGDHNVAGAELVVDDAVSTGPGFGLAMTGTFGGKTADVTGTIPAQATPAQCDSTAPPIDLHCLTSAKHTVFVRGLDDQGNWGVVGSVILNVAKAGPQTVGLSVAPSPTNGKVNVTLSGTGDDSAAGGTVTDAEYFLGTVGADGSGTAMTLNRVATKVAETATIPAARVLALGEGTTQVWVHSRNSQHIWGPAMPVDLPVDLTAPAVNAASLGPNPSNGLVSAKAYPGYVVFSAELQDRDAGGGIQNTVTGGEIFIDPASTAPANGSGMTLTAADGAFDSPTESVYGLIPLTQVRAMTEGEHLVYVHGKDAAGNWGSLTANNALVRLIVDRTAPVLGALSASPNPTNGATTLTLSAPVTESTAPSFTGPRFQAAEFWTGTTDPGAGKATRVQVSDTGTGVSASVPLDGIPAGSVRFNLRVQDAAGNWSNASATTVQVVPPNAIFSDTFDSGNLLAWSARTGAVTATAAAGIPNATGNYGLQATLSGGAANAPAYVTDNTPLGETSYHAQFSFNPNTLVTGTAWVTVFEGRTSTGQSFAVQYHRAGTQAPQLRTVMARATQPALTSTAYNLTAGAHTLRLDWRQGGATGTTAGQTVLSVDGTAVRTLTGANNTTALQIQSGNLGISAGTTTSTTMAGTAWFDSFVSTRFSIP